MHRYLKVGLIYFAAHLNFAQTLVSAINQLLSHHQTLCRLKIISLHFTILLRPNQRDSLIPIFLNSLIKHFYSIQPLVLSKRLAGSNLGLSILLESDGLNGNEASGVHGREGIQ